MTSLYYRGMIDQNGRPKIGRSARTLGIRPGVDVDVEEVITDDSDERGFRRQSILDKPSRSSTLVQYEAALAATQDAWERVQ